MDHQKSKRVPKDIYFCFIDYAKAFDCVDHNKLWTILKEMGIPDHLTCLLRNLYTGQEATVRTRNGTTDWFPVRKGVGQDCILVPCLFNLYAEYIMQNVGVDEAEVDVFLELLCFLHDPTNVGHLISCSAPSQEALAVKSLPANAGDIRDRVSIPGLGRSLE